MVEVDLHCGGEEEEEAGSAYWSMCRADESRIAETTCVAHSVLFARIPTRLRWRVESKASQRQSYCTVRGRALMEKAPSNSGSHPKVPDTRRNVSKAKCRPATGIKDTHPASRSIHSTCMVVEPWTARGAMLDAYSLVGAHEHLPALSLGKLSPLLDIPCTYCTLIACESTR